MTDEQIISEANALLREGFDQTAGDWRDRSTVVYVNEPPATYGKMIAGEPGGNDFREETLRIGRGAGTNFRRVFLESVPEGRAVVTFVSGREYPRVDSIEHCDGKVVLRCIHDFVVARDFKQVHCYKLAAPEAASR